MVLTLAHIPRELDDALRLRAQSEGKSVDQVAVEALRAGLGLATETGKLKNTAGAQSPVAPLLEEHDVVRVVRDVEAEGYSLRAGMVGAVVSVYGNGSAYAVEFPELEKGSAVVTLGNDDVERVGSDG